MVYHLQGLQVYQNRGLIHHHHKLSKNIYFIDERKDWNSLIIEKYYYVFRC